MPKQDKISEVIAYRPTPEDRKLIAALKAKTGLGTAPVIRLGLRRLAEAEGLKSIA